MSSSQYFSVISVKSSSIISGGGGGSGPSLYGGYRRGAFMISETNVVVFQYPYGKNLVLSSSQERINGYYYLKVFF